MTHSVHNARDPQLLTQEMIAETQDALKKWEGLVAAAGGSLAPEKSSRCLSSGIATKQWKMGIRHSNKGASRHLGQQ